MTTVKNKKTGQAGLLIKETVKTYKVCYLHKTIKNAHSYGYWKKKHCELNNIDLQLV